MIDIKNVKYTFKNGVHALNGVSLQIEDGEFVYIAGTTGSGKSTLIRLLNGELVPQKGQITVNGVNVGKLKNRKVPLYRRTIGVVFQEFLLLPKKTAFENIAYALEVVDMRKDDIRKRVREVLKQVELSDKANFRPDQLSGGQKQRVAIARAIANKPKIIIADEPTGNLDPETSDEIISLFEKINKEEGTTILIVTHDTEIVSNHPKRIIQIEDGNIAADVPYELVKESPSLAKLKKKNRIEFEDKTIEQVVKEEFIEKRLTDEISVLKEEQHAD